MAKLPDSGERREFTTGSVRDKVEGKGAYHLISPFPILQYALRMEDGMSKYGERNWERGQPIMQFFNSGLRHMFQWLEDCLLGNEPKEDHLGAALWNIGGIIHTLKMIKAGLLPEELDDRPFPELVLGKKAPSREDYGRTIVIPGESILEEIRSAEERDGEDWCKSQGNADSHWADVSEVTKNRHAKRQAQENFQYEKMYQKFGTQQDMPLSPEEQREAETRRLLKFVIEEYPELINKECHMCRHQSKDNVCVYPGEGCKWEFKDAD